MAPARPGDQSADTQAVWACGSCFRCRVAGLIPPNLSVGPHQGTWDKTPGTVQKRYTTISKGLDWFRSVSTKSSHRAAEVSPNARLLRRGCGMRQPSKAGGRFGPDTDPAGPGAVSGKTVAAHRVRKAVHKAVRGDEFDRKVGEGPDLKSEGSVPCASPGSARLRSRSVPKTEQFPAGPRSILQSTRSQSWGFRDAHMMEREVWDAAAPPTD